MGLWLEILLADWSVASYSCCSVLTCTFRLAASSENGKVRGGKQQHKLLDRSTVFAVYIAVFHNNVIHFTIDKRITWTRGAWDRHSFKCIACYGRHENRVTAGCLPAWCVNVLEYNPNPRWAKMNAMRQHDILYVCRYSLREVCLMFSYGWKVCCDLILKFCSEISRTNEWFWFKLLGQSRPCRAASCKFTSKIVFQLADIRDELFSRAI